MRTDLFMFFISGPAVKGNATLKHIELHSKELNKP